MGIPQLYNHLKQRGKIISQSSIQYAKYNVMDVNNIIYQLFIKNRKHLTPQRKLDIIMEFSNSIIQMAKSGKIFHLVLDPMQRFKNDNDITFPQYDFLLPYSIRLCKSQFQLCKNGNIVCSKDFKRSSDFKHKFIQKILKISQNKYTENQSWEVIACPIYDYIVLRQIFQNIPNVTLVIANMEADYRISKIVHDLQSQGVPSSDITIISKDGDIITRHHDIHVQCPAYYVDKIDEDYKYLYLMHSDFYESKKSDIYDFLKINNKEQYRQHHLRHACETENLCQLFSDVVMHHHAILEHETISMEDGFSSLEEAKTAFVIYQQAFFKHSYNEIIERVSTSPEEVKTAFVNYQQSFSKHLQPHNEITERDSPPLNPLTLRKVLDNQLWTNKLFEKEYLLYLYYAGLVERAPMLKQMDVVDQEQRDADRKKYQQL